MTDAERLAEIEGMLAEVQPYTEDYFGTHSWTIWTQENIDDLRYLIDRMRELEAEVQQVRANLSVTQAVAADLETFILELRAAMGRSGYVAPNYGGGVSPPVAGCIPPTPRTDGAELPARDRGAETTGGCAHEHGTTAAWDYSDPIGRHRVTCCLRCGRVMRAEHETTTGRP